MEGNARPRFTPRQKAELWERWRSGQCVSDIARALDRRNKSGVYRVLALNGGITPAARRRAPVALALEEREEISRGIAAGRSIRRIAARLGRARRRSRRCNRPGRNRGSAISNGGDLSPFSGACRVAGVGDGDYKGTGSATIGRRKFCEKSEAGCPPQQPQFRARY